MKKLFFTFAIILFTVSTFAEKVIYHNAYINMVGGQALFVDITNITEDSVFCYLWESKKLSYSSNLTSIPSTLVYRIYIDIKTSYYVDQNGKFYLREAFQPSKQENMQDTENSDQYIFEDNYYTSTNIIPTEAIEAPTGIVICKRGRYYINGEWIYPHVYSEFLKQNCNTAYSYYKSAEQLRKTGIGLFAAGGVISLFAGIPMLTYNGENDIVDKKGVQVTGEILIIFGTISFIPGVTCWTIGSVRMHKSAKIYNTCMSQRQSNASLSLNAIPMGVGCTISL